MFSNSRPSLDVLFFHENFASWRLRDIQRWSALIQNTFRSVSALFITWKSLNSADAALNQRWKTSKLWNSAVQRWLPLGLQPGLLTILKQEFFARKFLFVSLLSILTSSGLSGFFYKQLSKPIDNQNFNFTHGINVNTNGFEVLQSYSGSVSFLLQQCSPVFEKNVDHKRVFPLVE